MTEGTLRIFCSTENRQLSLINAVVKKKIKANSLISFSFSFNFWITEFLLLLLFNYIPNKVIKALKLLPMVPLRTNLYPMSFCWG